MSIAMTVPPLEGLEPNLVCLAYFVYQEYLIEIQTFSGDPADLGQDGRSHRLNRELLQPGKEKLASTCIGVNC